MMIPPHKATNKVNKSHGIIICKLNPFLIKLFNRLKGSGSGIFLFYIHVQV
jgi:hypothetical protein